MHLGSRHYAPYVQTQTFASIACDSLRGWHRDTPVVDNIEIEGSTNILTKLLHVTGPASALDPYGSSYSTVLDNGVHFTGDNTNPTLTIEPPLVMFDQTHTLTTEIATISFVKSLSVGAMSFGAPVLKIYAGGLMPAAVAGDRIIWLDGGATPNNYILTYSGSSWTTIPAIKPTTGDGVTLLFTGAYTQGVYYNATLSAPANYNGNPFFGYPDIKWYTVHATMNHEEGVMVWPNYFYHLTNGQGVGGVTHTNINAWLDQAVKSTSAPVFTGVTVTPSTTSTLVQSANEFQLPVTSATSFLNVPVALFTIGVVSGTACVATFIISAVGAGGVGNYSAYLTTHISREGAGSAVFTLTDKSEFKSGDLDVDDCKIVLVGSAGSAIMNVYGTNTTTYWTGFMMLSKVS